MKPCFHASLRTSVEAGKEAVFPSEIEAIVPPGRVMMPVNLPLVMILQRPFESSLTSRIS